MKIQFADNLIGLILDGKKTITWRIGEKYNKLSEEEILSLCGNDGVEFAKAKIISIKETTFGNLTKEDKEGHEIFSSDEEMYETYSRYYKTEITPKTRLKVIKFQLLK